MVFWVLKVWSGIGRKVKEEVCLVESKLGVGATPWLADIGWKNAASPSFSCLGNWGDDAENSETRPWYL